MANFKTDRSQKLRIPRVVYVLGGAVFVLGTSEFGIAGLLPEIAAELSVSVPDAGLLISAYAIAMVIGAPLLTVLSLRLPRRATVLGALALFVAAQAAGALAADYPTLLVARMLTAAATGAFWAAAATVVVSVVDPARRAHALSLQMAGLTIANVVGVPLGTLIGQQFGWRVTMWSIAAAATLATLLIIAVLTGGVQQPAPASVRVEFKAFASGQVWLVLLIIALFQTAVMACFSYLAPMITDVAELAPGMVPVALALFGIGSLIGVQLGGRLADAYPWHTLYAGLGAILLALLALALGGSVAPVALAAILALGIAAFAGAAAANGRLFTVAAEAPRLAGAVSASAFNVGATLGPWLGGLTITAGWGYRSPAAIGIGLVAIALGLGVLCRQLAGRESTNVRN